MSFSSGVSLQLATDDAYIFSHVTRIDLQVIQNLGTMNVSDHSQTMTC